MATPKYRSVKMSAAVPPRPEKGLKAKPVPAPKPTKVTATRKTKGGSYQS